MRISELIVLLTQYQTEIGDVPVWDFVRGEVTEEMVHVAPEMRGGSFYFPLCVEFGGPLEEEGESAMKGE